MKYDIQSPKQNTESKTKHSYFRPISTTWVDPLNSPFSLFQANTKKSDPVSHYDLEEGSGGDDDGKDDAESSGSGFGSDDEDADHNHGSFPGNFALPLPIAYFRKLPADCTIFFGYFMIELALTRLEATEGLLLNLTSIDPLLLIMLTLAISTSCT